uniref:UPF0173 metal-dependent hydrolase Tlet_1100 n=1 Tax=Anthurium amnicola TaxID=1678845 RepID=A0A1D1ZBX2_9ARAE
MYFPLVPRKGFVMGMIVEFTRLLSEQFENYGLSSWPEQSMGKGHQKLFLFYSLILSPAIYWSSLREPNDCVYNGTTLNVTLPAIGVGQSLLFQQRWKRILRSVFRSLIELKHLRSSCF